VPSPEHRTGFVTNSLTRLTAGYATQTQDSKWHKSAARILQIFNRLSPFHLALNDGLSFTFNCHVLEVTNLTVCIRASSATPKFHLFSIKFGTDVKDM
jgi:hypothetical protein